MRFNLVVPRLRMTIGAALFLLTSAGCNGGSVDGSEVRAAASQAAADRAAVEVLASQAAKDRAAAAAELVRAKDLADKQAAAGKAAAEKAASEKAAAEKAAAEKAAADARRQAERVSNPRTLVRQFLAGWQAKDRSRMERVAKPMAVFAFMQDWNPSEWSGFFVDSCEVDGSGECGFSLDAPEGGSFFFTALYSNAGPGGSLIIEEYEVLGGGG